MTHPGIQVWAFRRSYPELQDSLIRELAGFGYATALGAKWKEGTKDLIFPNGSVMRFRYCESMQDASRYQGAEMQMLIIDERTLLDPAVVEFLSSRLRSGDKRIPVLGIRSATNPGNIGHGAFKSRYVVATDYGEKTYEDGRGRLVRFIPAKIDDNPKLNPEYKADLDAIADESLRAALKDGNWDTFAGQYFSEWNYDRHVVEPFEIPEGWQRYAGIDWGYTAPHAVEWMAYNDGRAWVYRERYGTQTGERDLARLILEDEGALTGDNRALYPDEAPRRLGDPAMWGRMGEALPIAVTMIAAGVSMVPANNNRLSGWQRLHTFLAEGPACHIHRAKGWDTCPLLHVFSNCRQLIRTLPELIHDQRRPEDVDTDGDDHAADALRYAVMALPVPIRALEPRPEPSTPHDRIINMLERRKRMERNQRPVGL